MKKAMTVILISIFVISSSRLSVEALDCDSHLDIIQRLVYPYLSEVTKTYYGKCARIDRFDIILLDTGKTNDGDFILNMQIMPFIGPHNSISKVNVSLLCTVDEIRVINYEPIETYDYKFTPSATYSRLALAQVLSKISLPPI